MTHVSFSDPVAYEAHLIALIVERARAAAGLPRPSKVVTGPLNGVILKYARFLSIKSNLPLLTARVSESAVDFEDVGFSLIKDAAGVISVNRAINLNATTWSFVPKFAKTPPEDLVSISNAFVSEEASTHFEPLVQGSFLSMMKSAILYANKVIYARAITTLLSKIESEADYEVIESIIKARCEYDNNKLTPEKDRFSKLPASMKLLSVIKGQGEALVILKACWAKGFFSKEIYKLGMPLFGFNPLITNYNFVAKHSAVLSTLVKESKSLGYLALASSTTLAVPLSETLRSKKFKDDSFISVHGLSALKHLKIALKANGLIQPTWIWLENQPIKSLIPLMGNRHTAKLRAKNFNFLAKNCNKGLPSYASNKKLRNMFSDISLEFSNTDSWEPSDTDTANTELINARAMSVMCTGLNYLKDTKRINKEEFIRDLIVVKDSIRHFKGSSELANVSWKNLLETSNRIHRDMWYADRRNSIDLTAEWTPVTSSPILIEKSKNKPASKAKAKAKSSKSKRALATLGTPVMLKFTELATGAALAEEGHAMMHCVGCYHRSCKTGESVIFSVTENGERVSTLELRSSYDGGNTYRVAQNYGHHNSIVAQEIKDAGELACLEFNKRLAIKKAEMLKKAA